jgi:hypothetical protein
MSGRDAYTSIAVLPDADTVLSVRVQTTATSKVLASVDIGDGRNTTTVTVTDEDTLNRLVAAFGEARAKFVGAQTRMQQPELPAAC